MKKSSKSGEEEESGRNQELIQQLKHIEKEWEAFKKGNPENTRRCSTGSDSSSFINSFDRLLKNSPRGLMYSLQRRRSPSDGFLRERNCDVAVEEVLRERRDAIMSGKLKGRRLFGEEEGASEVELDLSYGDGDGDGGGGGGGGEVCGDWLDMVGEREVVRKEHELPDAISISCSLSDVSVSEEKEVMEEDKGAAEKRGDVGGGCGGGGGGRCIVAMAWLVFLLILLILGLISISCNGKSVHKNELILVPT